MEYYAMDINTHKSTSNIRSQYNRPADPHVSAMQQIAWYY